MRVKLVVDSYHKPAAVKVRKILSNQKVDIVKSGYDFVLIVGGDGTFFDRSLDYVSVPILTVKSNGKKPLQSRGFTVKCNLSNLEAAISNINNGRFSIKEEPVIELRYGGKRYFSINDMFVERMNTKRAVRYSILVKEGKKIFSTYGISNGFIVATPIGSTGYYAYSDRMANRRISRAEGLSVAHILPIQIADFNGKRAVRSKIRRSFSLKASIDARITRGPGQYLYGIAKREHGIKVRQGDRLIFSVAKGKVLKIIDPN
jgi:hypothetical protein